MRGALSLALAGIIAATLGVLGSVALAASLAGSSSEAVRTANDAATTPGVYGTK